MKMKSYKSSNPALSESIFEESAKLLSTDGSMSLQGTLNKTIFLLFLVMAASVLSWITYQDNFLVSGNIMGIFLGVFFCGIALTIAINLKKEWVGYLAPLYAITQGLFLGWISAFANARFPGIVMQTVLLTFGIFIVLLIIYKFKIIKPTQNFKLIVGSATSGLMLYYALALASHFFGWGEIPFIHENNVWGIVFSLFGVVLASFNLVIDFDFVDKGIEQGVPKFMEWYAAYGLMVTLIWLYIELLRLLGKSRRR